MEELERAVLLIAQYGVIPLFIIIVWYLNKKVNKLEKELDEKNRELKESDKENITLNYKLMGIIRKIENK